MDHTSGEVPTPDGDDPETMRRRGRLRSGAVEVLETLILTLVVFLVIQNFVAQPFKVDQHSMDRTLAEGDYVLVDRLTGRWSPYARGQVVVFQPPPAWTSRPEPYIKRVIGVGGDIIELRDGRVVVNGTLLDEPYLFRNDAGVAEPTEAGDQSRWVVPAGELFVMGDHRQVSADSRIFGAIPVSSVIGRGVVRYWPLPAFGIVETPSYGDVAVP
jgi:signal peptidase I